MLTHKLSNICVDMCPSPFTLATHVQQLIDDAGNTQSLLPHVLRQQTLSAPPPGLVYTGWAKKRTVFELSLIHI